jgi:hypothetical protein
MRDVLDELYGSGGAHAEEGAKSYRITPRYVEVRTHVNDGVLSTAVLFRDASSVAVAACLGKLFASSPVKRDDDIRLLETISPIAAQLARNTLDGAFVNGGLVRAQDPDDGARKTFVVSILENLEIESPRDFFERQLMRAHTVVLGGCIGTLMNATQRMQDGGAGLDFATIGRSFLNGMSFGLLFRPRRVTLDRGFLDLFTTPGGTGIPVDPTTVFAPGALEAYVVTTARS